MAMMDKANGVPSPVGILPLIHVKHILFGNKLVSIPFFDLGGVLADNEEIEKSLLFEAAKLGRNLGVSSIEFRQTEPLSCMKWNNKDILAMGNELRPMRCISRSHKVRMLLQLPGSSDALMKSFKAKLRSQIKVPVKAGLKTKIGGYELLDDFYKVFLVNMRDLGSPVHSKQLLQNVIKEFSNEGKIVVVYKENKPLACSFLLGYRNVLENPWASSLRKYGHLSPNMLLYWTMLEYGADHGYSYFDFGRSSIGEGTFKFKEQWGAIPMPLNWQYLIFDGNISSLDEKSKFEGAVNIWKNLPVNVTRIIGPQLRKYIAL
jgi:serine/alanine adding enzyme